MVLDTPTIDTAWLLDRIDTALMTGETWMLDSLAIQRAWAEQFA